MTSSWETPPLAQFGNGIPHVNFSFHEQSNEFNPYRSSYQEVSSISFQFTRSRFRFIFVNFSRSCPIFWPTDEPKWPMVRKNHYSLWGTIYHIWLSGDFDPRNFRSFFHNIFFRHFYFIRYYQWVYYYCFCLFIYFIFARGTGQQQQPARQNVFHQCFARPSHFRSTQHLLLQSFTGKLCTNNSQGVDHQGNLVRTSLRSAVWVGRRSYYNKR